MSFVVNFDKPSSDQFPFAVVFDLETTGLPQDDRSPTKIRLEKDPDAYPRIVQIAWLVLAEDGSVVSKGSSYIKQKKQIPRDSIAIHGITTEMANSMGRELKDVLQEFVRQIEFCDVIVAFNIDFDQYTLEAECIREGLAKPFKGKTRFCAMKKCERITGRKFMKLQKVVEIIGIEFSKPLSEKDRQGHNAEIDCVHAACIYLYLRRLDGYGV